MGLISLNVLKTPYLIIKAFQCMLNDFKNNIFDLGRSCTPTAQIGGWKIIVQCVPYTAPLFV